MFLQIKSILTLLPALHISLSFPLFTIFFTSFFFKWDCHVNYHAYLVSFVVYYNVRAPGFKDMISVLLQSQSSLDCWFSTTDSEVWLYYSMEQCNLYFLCRPQWIAVATLSCLFLYIFGTKKLHEDTM